jgi:hypothetical protein
MKKGFFAGVVIVVLAFVAFLTFGASIPTLAAFRPGGMINQGQGVINRQNISGATATTSPTNGAEAMNCYPDPQNPRYKCIPRDRDGNAGQLGSVIPDDYQGLPSSGYFEGR